MVQEENGITNSHYSPRGYWRVVAVLVKAKKESGMLVGLTGNAVVRGLRRGMGAGTFMCACGGLSASGALMNAFKGVERGGLTKFNCPGMLNLRGN